MSKYDDASWHYGGDYPANLPNENAATHIGMFLNWCIDNNLISKELEEVGEEELVQIKNRELTGAELLIEVCDEKLLDDDLNEMGNEFAADYYEDKTEFAKKYNSYAMDYSEIFDKKAEQSGVEYPSFYHVENTFENYDLIKAVIDQRFEEWKQYKNK